MNERFTLGKEYDVDGNYEYCYVDEETGKTFNFADEYCEEDFLKLVNTVIDNLKKENEQLKSYNGEMEDYLARLEEENEQLKKQLDGQPLKLEDDDNKSDRINMNYKELDFIIRTFRDLNNLSYSELLLIKDFCNNLKEDKNNLFLIQENND